MRTYLYVDGENFAIRAHELNVKLEADVAERARMIAEMKGVSQFWDPQTFANAEWGPDSWAPEPHAAFVAKMYARKTRGILYSRNEVFWDPIGLYIALSAGLVDGLRNGKGSVPIDKAYYYAAAAGPRIEQHKADLHALGFSPHVLQRVRPDSFAKEMAAQGITVISCPKPIDIMIATQVLDDCASDNFDRCIFVGGDADYVPLLEAVRRRGKQVWLVAFERWLDKANALRFACDRFFAYDAVLAARGLPADEPEVGAPAS